MRERERDTTNDTYQIQYLESFDTHRVILIQLQHLKPPPYCSWSIAILYYIYGSDSILIKKCKSRPIVSVWLLRLGKIHSTHSKVYIGVSGIFRTCGVQQLMRLWWIW